MFSTFAEGYKNTATTETREETQESSLISKEKVNRKSLSIAKNRPKPPKNFLNNSDLHSQNEGF